MDTEFHFLPIKFKGCLYLLIWRREVDEANSRSIAEFVAETNFGNNEFDKSILPIAIVLFDAYGSPELKESLQRGVGKKMVLPLF